MTNDTPLVKRRSTRAKSGPRVADVARHAEVSSAVVYSFLNGKFYGNGEGGNIGISEATQKRIVEAMDEMGFVPLDPISRVRVRQKQGGFLMMLSESIRDGVANPYFSRIFQGFSSEGSRDGRAVSLATFRQDLDYVEHPTKLPSGVQQRLINKVLLAGSANYSLIFALKRAGCAVAYASRNLGMADVPGIVPDYRAAAELAIRHLANLGHRRIGLAAGLHARPEATFFKELTAGCAETWRSLGFREPEPCFVFPSQDQPDACHYLKELDKEVPGLTAIFCFDDFAAISLINAATGQGRMVPRDLSVIGCNDEARLAQIPLTTIRIPKMQLGETAARLLDSAIAQGQKHSVESVVLPVEIKVRQTTGKVKF